MVKTEAAKIKGTVKAGRPVGYGSSGITKILQTGSGR
jgi:hypothetical protein